MKNPFRAVHLADKISDIVEGIDGAEIFDKGCGMDAFHVAFDYGADEVAIAGQYRSSKDEVLDAIHSPVSRFTKGSNIDQELERRLMNAIVAVEDLEVYAEDKRGMGAKHDGEDIFIYFLSQKRDLEETIH